VLLVFINNERGGPAQAAGTATDAAARETRQAPGGPTAASAGLTGPANRPAPRLPDVATSINNNKDKNEDSLKKMPARAPTAEQARVGRTIGQLYNNFDPAVAAELFSRSPTWAEEYFVWMRARLGGCGDGEPMNVANEIWSR